MEVHPSGGATTGTGSPLDFGLKTTAGIYTVVATSIISGCTNNMLGSSIIGINPLPVVYFVTGGGNYCTGGVGVHVGLNFSNSGINYLLSAGGGTIATVPGSSAGLDFGLQTTPGTYNVTAVDAATGCTKNMSGTATVGTEPLPSVYVVTGGGSYCPGNPGPSITLSGSNAGINYQLFYDGIAVTPGGLISGSGTALNYGPHAGTGSYTVVGTNVITSCSNNMSGSAMVSANTAPTAYTVSGAGSSYCAGGTGIDVSLSGSDAGVNYQLYKTGATVSGGFMTGSGSSLDFGKHTVAGSYTVIGTNTVTGCTTTMTGSATISINSLPYTYSISGGGSYCDLGTGVHISLSGSNIGINYQLNNSGVGPIGTVVSGSGSSIDFGAQTDPGAYTISATDAVTGCSSNMIGTATVSINSLPAVHSVTGGGNYCYGGAGADVGLDGSEASNYYQLYNASAAYGGHVAGSATASALDFGLLPAGNYTVMAVNATTGCSSAMTGSAMVGLNPLPAPYPVSSGGAYCAGGTGVDITLLNSDAGVSYQLYYGGLPVTGGEMTGTGTSIDFGLQTGAGVYAVIATNGTGCNNNMTGTALVAVTPVPTVETVTGGGNYCMGGTGYHINLGATDNGITYQLYNDSIAVGSVMTGTGSGLDFGLYAAPGTYMVIASPGGICQTTMSGMPTITILPLPTADSITGGGIFCANSTGLDVGLNGSTAGITYQLFNGATALGSLTGTGGPISFGPQSVGGSYSVVATNPTTGCTNNMLGSGATSITVLPVPTAYTVGGGGSYCAGGSGVHITLSTSATDIRYQLYFGGVAVTGANMPGTGTLLDFGLQTSAGNYSIGATDMATSCMNNMNDTVSVSVTAIPNPGVTVVPHPGLTLNPGERDTLVATATVPSTYQWYLDGQPVLGATNAVFVSNKFANGDSVVCEVTATGQCGGETAAHGVLLTVRNIAEVAQISSNGSNVIVVPNPNKGIFTVSGSFGNANDEEVTIEVTDLLGHIVYSAKTTTQNGNINDRVQLANTLANGMYLLNVRSQSDSKVFHIVIEQ